MNPLLDMLAAAAVRRHNEAAFLRALELTDIRHHAFNVGPSRDAVTNAVMVRQSRPETPELNMMLARLAALTNGRPWGQARSAPAAATSVPPPVMGERGLIAYYGDPRNPE